MSLVLSCTRVLVVGVTSIAIGRKRECECEYEREREGRALLVLSLPFALRSCICILVCSSPFFSFLPLSFFFSSLFSSFSFLAGPW
jgi:hypothetical protein